MTNRTVFSADADATRLSAAPATDSVNRHLLRGINPKNTIDEYELRDLDGVDDAHLCRQAAEIISSPLGGGLGSFGLHAPLELLARYGLLPLVSPRERKSARLQLVTTAAKYESGAGGSAPRSFAAFASPAVAKKEFAKAFRGKDADALESMMLQFAEQYGTGSLVHLLTPLALPTLTGASHSHIGLWLLMRHGRPSDVGDASLLRVAVRSLARDPSSQLRSFSHMEIASDKPLERSTAEIEREIVEKLATATRGPNAYGSMQALLTAGEATGNPDVLFGDFIRHDLTNDQIDAAFRAIMRVCAHNMLQHDTEYAKFGWSHCLTLPQAACGLSTLNIDRKLALASALVWITGYRSVLSDRDLDLNWRPEKLKGSASLIEALQTSSTAAASRVWHADAAESSQIKQTLATQASIRPDQHLIKYTRACLDMISFDPGQEKLYLAAAAHLCSVWIRELPQTSLPKIPDRR